jgi:hypothetical protein
MKQSWRWQRSNQRRNNHANWTTIWSSLTTWTQYQCSYGRVLGSVGSAACSSFNLTLSAQHNPNQTKREADCQPIASSPIAAISFATGKLPLKYFNVMYQLQLVRVVWCSAVTACQSGMVFCSHKIDKRLALGIDAVTFNVAIGTLR